MLLRKAQFFFSFIYLVTIPIHWAYEFSVSETTINLLTCEWHCAILTLPLPQVDRQTN